MSPDALKALAAVALGRDMTEETVGKFANPDALVQEPAHTALMLLNDGKIVHVDGTEAFLIGFDLALQVGARIASAPLDAHDLTGLVIQSRLNYEAREKRDVEWRKNRECSTCGRRDLFLEPIDVAGA